MVKGDGDGIDKWQQEADPVVHLRGKSRSGFAYSVTNRMRFLSRSPWSRACFHFLHIHSLWKGHFSSVYSAHLMLKV